MPAEPRIPLMKATIGWVLLGRKLTAYAYQAAMKNAEFVWDKDRLDHFISDPDALVLEMK
jgi:cytochrome c2